MTTTYRASKHVTLGKNDDHSYNMFVSFFEQCRRLGLWKDHIYWARIAEAYYRLAR